MNIDRLGKEFHSQLERAKQGVFHWLSKDHIQRSINEVVFRWNQRRTVEKTSKTGKRISAAQGVPRRLIQPCA